MSGKIECLFGHHTFTKYSKLKDAEICTCGLIKSLYMRVGQPTFFCYDEKGSLVPCDKLKNIDKNWLKDFYIEVS